MRWVEAAADPVFREFWERRLTCLISTVRPDGRPHTVAVNAMLDVDPALVWVLARRGSVKVANLRAGSGACSVTRIDGVRWSSVEGLARVREEPAVVAEAERRYAQRYREPRPNPERVVIELQVHSVLGRL